MSEKKDSIYSRCSEYVAIAEGNQKVILQTNKIADAVLSSADLRDISREELERKYVKAVIAVNLCDHGYRSVLPGYGFYVNAEKCSNPIYMQKLLENAEGNETVKKIILESLQKNVIQKYAKGLMSVPKGQMRFYQNGEMVEEPTIDEMLEMLAADA